MLKLLQWLKSPPIVIRQGVEWNAHDGELMRAFWVAGTGTKLRAILDDAVYTAAVSGRDSQFVQGMIAMRDYLLKQQAPAVEEAPADSAEGTTLQ